VAHNKTEALAWRPLEQKKSYGSEVDKVVKSILDYDVVNGLGFVKAVRDALDKESRNHRRAR